MSARIIDILVENEYVQGAGVVVGSAGSSRDVALRITFGDPWDGYSKRINWHDSTGGNATLTVLTANMLEPGTTNVYIVPIPAGPKKYEGKMMMVAQGYTLNASNQIDQIAVSATAYFQVLPADWTLDDDESVDPTLAQQLQAEIDDLLDDIATVSGNISNSEAWAVGTRDGAAVDITDETYHNNSKYYSEQSAASASDAAASESNAAAYEADALNSKAQAFNSASDAASYANYSKSYAVGGTGTRAGEDTDNAKWYRDDAARIVAEVGYGDMLKTDYDPMIRKEPVAFASDMETDIADAIDTAGANADAKFVSYASEQTLTDAQKQTARKNIQAGGTNPNLLKNPWFRVNSEGKTSVSSTAPLGTTVVDGWGYQAVNTSSSITIQSDSITISPTTAVIQIIEKADDLTGKNLAVSLLINGTVYSALIASASFGTSVVFPYENLRFTLIDFTSNGLGKGIQIYNASSSAITIKAVKLELGEVSTLANDVPPDDNLEYVRCNTSKALTFTTSSFSSLPQTFSNSAITPDMVVANAVLSNPAAQTGNWTWNTDTVGQLTISGSISGSTTMTVTLVPSR
jgi:hypothetical protein